MAIKSAALGRDSNRTDCMVFLVASAWITAGMAESECFWRFECRTSNVSDARTPAKPGAGLVRALAVENTS